MGSSEKIYDSYAFACGYILSPVVCLIFSVLIFFPHLFVETEHGYSIKYSLYGSTLSYDDYRGTTDIGIPTGNNVCITNYPVLVFTNLTYSSYKDGSVHTCYVDGNDLVFAEENEGQTEREPNRCTCFFKGNALVFSRGVNTEFNWPMYRRECYLKGNRLSFKRYMYDMDNANQTLCQLKGNGRFYADDDTDRRVTDLNLARCYHTGIFDVPIVGAIMVYISVLMVLRIFIFPGVCLCVGRSNDPFVVVLVYFILEVLNLVVFVVYPYVFTRYEGLTRTTIYYVTLVFFNITTLVSLIMVLVSASGKGYCGRKPKYGRRVVRTPPPDPQVVHIWSTHPRTPGPARRVPESVVEVTVESVRVELAEFPSQSGREEEDVRTLVRALWASEKVGIGRDARGLTHTSIDILSITKVQTPIPDRYKDRKRDVERYASSFPSGQVMSLEEFRTGGTPIGTSSVITSKCPRLKGSFNDDINEVYLFHGTPFENVASIEERGFDITKCKSSFVGRGIYFADSPVKADQYTGKTSADCTMLLTRVLLGKTVVLKDSSYMGGSPTPPCSSCLKVGCQKRHVPHSRPFDSVTLDQSSGLFREFIIFDSALAHPEFVIKYRRWSKL